jgi:biotin carboxyl carrier protein
VFAALDGKVQDINVEHGSLVQQGDVLLVQRSLDLEKEIEAVRGRMEETSAGIRSTNRELSGGGMSDAEEGQKVAQLAQARERLVSLRKNMELLEEKQRMLEIRSPIAGQIVTWNVKDQLPGRPVSRGQILLEVADPSGDWELEVVMPESRMGHIAEAWAQTDGNLPVTFFLATSPADKLNGKVVEVHRSAEVRGEDGNTVLLRVAFDQQDLRDAISDPKIGAGATAKVHCGTEPIGYVWLHDMIDFIRAKILFRL